MDTIKKNKPPQFPKSASSDFYSEVKRRVNHYFQSRHLSPHVDMRMAVKTGVLLMLWISTYVMLMTNQFGPAGSLVCFAVIGLLIALLGFNVCHDLLHGSYFKSSKLNEVLGYLFDIHGTSSFIWKITHNVKHHTYTNIHGQDEDIDKMILLRLSPFDGYYWFHRYQHIYAPFLYGLISLRWIFFSDYIALYELIKEKKIGFNDLFWMLVFKVVNIVMYVILPFTVLTLSLPVIFLGLALLHLMTSLALSFVFQLAHVVQEVEQHQADASGKMKNDWAAHEMRTTANFGTESQLLNVLVGGLNFQVEHHLFPKVCHVHYPAIRHIVKETAREYQLPYHEIPTFWQALNSHFTILKRHGGKPVMGLLQER